MFSEPRKLMTFAAVMLCIAAILLCAAGIQIVFGQVSSLVSNVLSVFV